MKPADAERTLALIGTGRCRFLPDAAIAVLRGAAGYALQGRHVVHLDDGVTLTEAEVANAPLAAAVALDEVLGRVPRRVWQPERVIVIGRRDSGELVAVRWLDPAGWQRALGGLWTHSSDPRRHVDAEERAAYVWAAGAPLATWVEMTL